MFPFVYDYTVFKYRLGVSAEPSGGDTNLGSQHFIYNLKEPEAFHVCFYMVIIAIHTTLPPREAAVLCSIKSSPESTIQRWSVCAPGEVGRGGSRRETGEPGPPGASGDAHPLPVEEHCRGVGCLPGKPHLSPPPPPFPHTLT